MLGFMNERSIRLVRRVFAIGLAGLLVVVALLAARVVYASIPDANGVIDGCYDSGNGKLRVIDTAAGEVCRSSETALSWNQTGQQGPAGLRGPSDGYAARLLPFQAKNIDSADINVLTLSLPAGDYILSLSARVERTQTGTTSVFCDFRVGGGPFPNGYLENLDGTGDVATIAATTGLSLSSTKDVHLTCRAFGDSGTQVSLADLTAIRVGKLTKQ
jgi:hypothetical protein